MENEFYIKQHSVHLWRVFVPELLAYVDPFSCILSADEIQRATRFRFNHHRQRYIIARAVLRQILQLYTERSAAELVFLSGERGKPHLQDNALDLQFNISHSHDMAVYALTTRAEIGVDIEKMEPRFSEGIAERFFSQDEYAQLSLLPENQQIPAFYYLWAGKEAIIKALGEGFHMPLSAFSIKLHEEKQAITIHHHDHQHIFHLEYFTAHPEYQSAFASPQSVEHIQYYQWTANGPALW